MLKYWIRGVFCLVTAVNLSFGTLNTPRADETVTVDISRELGTVSPNIMGFNIVYCYEGDNVWQNGSGKVPGLLKSIGTAQLRYPGGTVVTRYHWETPTGQGWQDSWDPDFDASKNTAPSEFMNIDEYLDLTRKQRLEPLVGINMGSGMKYGRVQEGIAEAVRLMKHCLAKGVKVKYYYLDNEPYQPDANFTYTPEQYADMINQYVPAMKKIDPGIKIIVNTQPRPDSYLQPLLQKAGKNIDLVDVHMYWRFKNATFDNWKKEIRMTHQGKSAYADQKKIWEKAFADAGYPGIKLVVLEWNIGPPGDNNTPPTDTEAALMVSEQFTQYIQSGLQMSCFWPVSWPDQKNWHRALFKNDYRANKLYGMFAQYTDVLGQQQVSSGSSNPALVNLAVKSTDGKTLWVYLLNKDQEKETLDLHLSTGDFKPASCSAVAFDGNDRQPGALALTPVALLKTGPATFTASIPKNSWMKITFSRPVN